MAPKKLASFTTLSKHVKVKETLNFGFLEIAML